MSILSQRAKTIEEKSKILKDPVIVRANPWSTTNPTGNVNLETAVNPLCADLWEKKFKKDFQWTFDPEIMQYSNFQGGEKVKKTVAAFIERFFKADVEIDPNNLRLFPGTSAAINALAHAICDENESIIVPAPFYDRFVSICADRANVRIVPSNMTLIQSPNCLDADEFIMDVTQIQLAYEKAQSEHHIPRAIILCNPNNPLGVAYSPEEIFPILQFAEDKGLFVIMDEIYGLSLHKECSKFQSIMSWLSNAPNRRDIIWIAGLSKDFGLPSFKLSILYIENKELINHLNSFQGYQPVPLPIQQIGARILSDYDWIENIFLPTNLERLQINKDLALKRLKEIGAPVHRCDSATFVFCDFRKFMKVTTEENELKLYWAFVKAGVFMKSGKILRCPVPGWFRIVVTVPMDMLTEGLNRIETVLHTFRDHAVSEEQTLSKRF